MPATLYVVGTPIGNLEDLSPRAARVLRAVALVAAEDTRVTRRLLSRIDAHPWLISFNEHNWRERMETVLQALEQGDAALVSDAGMPGVSDPGRELVAAAAARGIRIESVPGPSAVTTALAVSGLPADAFRFLGFLPRRRRTGWRGSQRPPPAPIRWRCSRLLTACGLRWKILPASSATAP